MKLLWTHFFRFLATLTGAGTNTLDALHVSRHLVAFSTGKLEEEITEDGGRVATRTATSGGLVLLPCFLEFGVEVCYRGFTEVVTSLTQQRVNEIA